MDLNEAWKNLDKEKLSKPVEGAIAVPRYSRHPVSQLIHKFKLGLAFCVFFTVIFLFLFIAMEQPVVKLGLAVVVLLYGVLFAMNYRVMQNLKRLNHSDQSVVSVLKASHAIVTQTIKSQQRFSWIFFPVCVVGGFMLGLSLKKNVAETIVQPKLYLSLMATIIIITPAAYFLAKWMTKLSYGKYLEQIESLLNQTKED